MASENVPLTSFNRGIVSKYALARVDIDHLRLAAQIQTNWMPTVLGPMMLRPGLQHVDSTYTNLTAKLVPFVFSLTDLAYIEFTNNVMRVTTVSNDVETLIVRPSVSTVVTNGDFSSSSGWTVTETGAGADVDFAGNKLLLISPALGGLAQAKQELTISGGDQNVEHAFRITVERGPVTFRCGTADGLDDLIAVATLDEGSHSLAFTPTSGSAFFEIETQTAQQKILDDISIEPSGALAIPTTFAVSDLPEIKYTQSGDIIFIACYGQKQRKVERRGPRSWSFVNYDTNNGPFGTINATDTSITPGALTGSTTLTASRSIFGASDVDSLIRLFSSGQVENASLTAENTFTDPIRISGADSSRDWTRSITGTWVGTLTLQRSFESATTGFQDTTTTYTTNSSGTTNEDFDNTISWLRIGFKTGDFTSGTAVIEMTYPGGGDVGFARIEALTSGTVVDVEVLTPFSSTNATTSWNYADWSDFAGWPSAVAFFDGRLWWAGRDKVWGSVSDDYYNFDGDTEGDAGPLNRSVGFGPIDKINWLLPLNRLIVGREGAETSIRSGSFDVPLTPTNFTLKDASTYGSAAIQAVRVDGRGIFVDKSNKRTYELAFDGNAQDHIPNDLTRLAPEVSDGGFVSMDVRRQPDTELHYARTDGKVATLLHDWNDGVTAWWLIDSSGADGVIEDVMTLPGVIEDRIYYVVKRTVDGNTVRFIEKLARRDQSLGQPECRCADSHVMYDGVSSAAMVGLDHLEGEEVVVWGWNDTDTAGKDLGTYTVTSGAITLSEAVENACIGLGYSAAFKSAKLAYASRRGTALAMKKKLSRLGLILADVHYQGLEYGQSFEEMDNLPLSMDSQDIPVDTVHSEYDEPMSSIPGAWTTDSRLYLRATAPRPCTVMAAIIDISTNG